MEKTICFVVGLPGSGKTLYLEQLQKSGFLTINNPVDFDQDILPHLKEDGQVIAIADHSLCFSASREKMVIKIGSVIRDVIYRWIYFENDPIQCLSNIRASGITDRVDFKDENYLWQVSQGYSIPANIETRPVARLDDSVNKTWLSYDPATTANTTFKLVRVKDDLVVFSAPEWDHFRPMAWFILQKYPTHHFRIVEEVITRTVTEIILDRLIN